MFLSGLVLLGGLIFFYMKYKSLQKNYSQMGDQFHEDDEMKVVYHGEMEAGNTTEKLYVLNARFFFFTAPEFGRRGLKVCLPAACTVV